MTTVAELMTPAPQTVGADTPLDAAARRMLRLDIRHLPVVGEGGALVGVVTDTVIFARGGLVGAHEELWVPFDAADAARTCGEVALPVEAVPPDAPLDATLRRLVEGRLDVVVVVDDDRRPVGVITEHDGVRLAAGALDDAARREGQRPVHALRRDAPARRALDLMQAHRVRHVLVTEADGRLYGVLSFGDLVADAAATRDLRADDVVRAGRLVVERDEPGLKRAARIMARHKVGCLPIVDAEGRPRSVLTRADVIAGLVAAGAPPPPAG